MLYARLLAFTDPKGPTPDKARKKLLVAYTGKTLSQVGMMLLCDGQEHQDHCGL